MRQPILGRRRAAGAATLHGPNSRSADGFRAEVRTDRRSSRYVDAIGRLDAGVVHDADVSEIAETVRAEFGPGASMPVGLLARCFLGAPYEVHTIDLTDLVVEHYELGRALPEPYARARRLALHPAYLAIEVYRDRLVCLREDGTAVEIA